MLAPSCKNSACSALLPMLNLMDGGICLCQVSCSSNTQPPSPPGNMRRIRGATSSLAHLRKRANGAITQPSRAATTAGVSSSYVPVIDLASLRLGSREKKQAVAREIRSACEHVGFFVVTSHGVPTAVIDRAWRSCRAFFDLPPHVKGAEDVVMRDDEYPYGYCGLGVEILSKGKDYEEGRVTVSAPDLKESFSMGPYNPASGMPPTRWPRQPQDFEPSLLAYYQEMEKLASLLLGSFALALELPEDWFQDKVHRHCSALRVLNYPDLTQDPQPGQLRASSHTDYGIMTILRQDNAPGGLQVMKRSGEWVEVPQIPNAYVINLGDLMQRWTNERWVSTPHRVVCPPRDKYGKSRRQSIAYFFNINADQMVECIETCVTADRPAKYPPVNAMEFLLAKHAASTGKHKMDI